MNFWVHTVGTFRATAILSRVHKAFFNYHFNEMTYMPDEIILARIMTALDLEFERALHYYDEGYDSDYGLPCPFMRPTHIYLLSTTEASFNPTIIRGHNVPPLHSHQGNPGISCLSAKKSVNN